MINFGFHSGPDKAVPPPKKGLLDYVMEYTVVFLMIVTGVLTLFYYSQLSGKSLTECWINLGLIILFVASYWFVERAPIQLYHFPVRITERNVYVQYFLASRTSRVVIMLAAFMMFFSQLKLLASNVWIIDKDLFFVLFICAFAGLIVALIVYYILAIRYRC